MPVIKTTDLRPDVYGPSCTGRWRLGDQAALQDFGLCTIANVAFDRGPWGSRGLFNGVSSLITVPRNPSWNVEGATAFSIRTLLRTGSIGAVRVPVYKETFGGGYQFGLIINANGTVSFGSGATITSVLTVSANTHYDIMLTKGAVNNYIYVNGVQWATDATGAIGTQATNMGIGAKNAGGGTAFWFNGYVYEVDIFDRDLSLAEHQYLYNKVIGAA